MNFYRNRLVRYLIWRFVLRNPALRIKLQRLLFATGPKDIDLLAQPMRVDAQKEIGYVRAAEQQGHNVLFRDEVPQLLSVMSLLEDGATFVDVGANAGLWSVTAASIARMRPSLNVIAIEANPDTFERLAANLGRFPNAIAHNVAVSDVEAELQFYGGATSGVFGAAKGPFNTDDTVAIRAVPLDPIIQGADKLVIKIDVEGHEAPVLRGMRRAFEEGRVRAVFIDGYPRAAADEIVGTLIRYGFSLFDGRTRKDFDPSAEYTPLLALA